MYSEEEFKKVSKAWKTSEDGKMDIKWMITEWSPRWGKAPWPSRKEAEKIEAPLTKTTDKQET